MTAYGSLFSYFFGFGDKLHQSVNTRPRETEGMLSHV